MDNISTLENDIDEKIRRINDFIVSNILKEENRGSLSSNDKDSVSKLELENRELRAQLSLLQNNHEKDLQNLSEIIRQLEILMEEADD